MRPLLLLDVDGVLMPTGTSVPPGFERHVGDDYEVVVSHEHGVWLRQLAGLFDLVWATSWGASAPRIFGGLLQLPPMPVVELRHLVRDGTPKLPDVSSFVGERALAWVDDELFEDAFEWAANRRAPTLLIRASGSKGLSRENFDQLLAFAQQVTSEPPSGDRRRPTSGSG